MKTITIDNLNIHDKRFCITFPLDDDDLRASIEKVGIIQPILLFNTTPYIIITGFKRVTAAQQLGLNEVPCIPVDLTEQQAFLLAIHDNIHRGLNLVEKAHAVERMLHMGFTSQDINEMVVVLGFQPHEKIMKTLVALANAEGPLKGFMVSHNLPMKIADSFMRFEAHERFSILNLLSSVHVTESTTREILGILNLLKVKQGNLSLGSLHPENIHELTQQLKEIAYPILTSFQEKLRGIRHISALPPNIDIKVDPFFEKEYIDIGIRAKNKDDVCQALEKLHSLVDDGILGSIFDLTKGNLR